MDHSYVPTQLKQYICPVLEKLKNKPEHTDTQKNENQIRKLFTWKKKTPCFNRREGMQNRFAKHKTR